MDGVILRLVAEAGPDGSIATEEVARAIAQADGSDWHRALPAVRRAALDLARHDRIDILRKGKRVEPDAARGVIRLRMRKAQNESA